MLMHLQKVMIRLKEKKEEMTKGEILNIAHLISNFSTPLNKCEKCVFFHFC